MEKTTRKFQLAFDEKQISILVAGLHELPGKLCIPIIGSIQDQISAQTQEMGKNGQNI